MIELMEHQALTRDFGRQSPLIFDQSDAGTGKTISHLMIHKDRRDAGHSRRLLVLCPKSIMELAWGADIRKACPDLSYVCAYAENRVAAFESNASIVITNHDAVRWLKDNPKYLEGFTDLIVDESTAYKNPTSQRTKAIMKLAAKFGYRTVLSGTAKTKSITELWSQAFILDQGERLGPNFYRFRAETCQQEQIGRHAKAIKWTDRPGIDSVIASMLADITIRHSRDDCLDLPENQIIRYDFPLQPRHLAMYEQLRDHAVLSLEEGTVSSFQQGALRMKLRQAAAGTVYGDDGSVKLLSPARYELVADLAEARTHVVIPFCFKHQLDALRKEFDRRGMTYGEIHGDISAADRTKFVDAFQAGQLDHMFIHPASAAHGITLTSGVATIWVTPIDSTELFLQTNARIHRAGQKNRTETILIQGQGTLEAGIYDNNMDEAGGLYDLHSLLV